MEDQKKPDLKAPKSKKLDKKYPKPWTQEIHDRYLKDMGMTKEEHDEWHRQHDKSK
jgi:hypothetical protein